MKGPVGKPPDELGGLEASPRTPAPGVPESDGPTSACELSLGHGLGTGLELEAVAAAAGAGEAWVPVGGSGGVE
jgi:hypothetical protein